MRKSGWAVAAGLGSLVLLLTACGGSSSSSSSSPPSTGTGSTQSASAAPSGILGLQSGDTVLIVQHSNLGWVLAEANGDVVYTYKNDTKGGSPTCTGSCASIWSAVTGVPKVIADTLPGTLGTVAMANGGKQVTYDGYPLYTYKGAGPLTTKGNDIEGLWHVVKMSKSDINGA